MEKILISVGPVFIPTGCQFKFKLYLFLHASCCPFGSSSFLVLQSVLFIAVFGFWNSVKSESK